jgi:phage tail sheath protein FI
VARLVAYLRGQLETIAKQYLFEPNDQITRNEISNAITSLMVDLVAKRALYDYLVICDLTNNTPARIDRNELWVDIAIEPVKSIEFIYIPVRILNTGEIAALSSTTAQ